MHYGAIDCLEYHGKHVLGPDDLSLVAFMIGMHSWWDSVDGLASRVVGPLVLRNREELESRVDLWGDCENMWFRRTALLYQLKYKEQTDVERLAEHCRTMASDDAFFIQKAIGWALREYAKTDPQWVRAFVDKTTLSGLSRREALKNIGYE